MDNLNGRILEAYLGVIKNKVNEEDDDALSNRLAKKLKDQWKKIAGEPVEIEAIKGSFYGYCSELGTYRLFMKYTNKGKNNPNNKFDVGYSSNLKKYYFRMET